eukprot:jgi/Psemu1/5057/gm1.5057_g
MPPICLPKQTAQTVERTTPLPGSGCSRLLSSWEIQHVAWFLTAQLHSMGNADGEMISPNWSAQLWRPLPGFGVHVLGSKIQHLEAFSTGKELNLECSTSLTVHLWTIVSCLAGSFDTSPAPQCLTKMPPLIDTVRKLLRVRFHITGTVAAYNPPMEPPPGFLCIKLQWVYSQESNLVPLIDRPIAFVGLHELNRHVHQNSPCLNSLLAHGTARTSLACLAALIATNIFPELPHDP